MSGDPRRWQSVIDHSMAAMGAFELDLTLESGQLPEGKQVGFCLSETIFSHKKGEFVPYFIGFMKYYLHSKMIVPFLRFLFFRESLFTLVCIQIPLSQNKITLQNNISPRKKQS